MNELFIFTSSLFFLWVVRETFFWLTAWQINDYRPDRFFAYIKRKKGKAYSVLSLLMLLKWLVFFGYALVIFDDNLLATYQSIVAALFFLQAFLIGKEIYLNQLRKPRLTLRANLIIILSLVVVFILFAFPLMEQFFWIVFIDLLIPLIISFFVFLFLFPIEVYTDWQAEKAIQKLRTDKNLLVIGVTGSHGKSATKDYIAEVLSYKFRVIKTEKKDNTSVGITKTILKRLQDDTEIFVVEMSAYKRGEIDQLCTFIKPKIGVLTGINNQYLSLFNGLENITKTNYELVESLPKNGLCLFNGMNKNTQALFKKSRKQKVLYDISEKKDGTVDSRHIVAYNVAKTPKRTSFDVSIGEKKLHLILHAPHPIERILPAIYLAQHLGMNQKEIKNAIASLK